MAGADARRASLLRRAGIEIGVAFQVRDDWLGIWGDSDVTGKGCGDIARRKITYPVVAGQARLRGAAQREFRRLYRQPGGDEECILALARGGRRPGRGGGGARSPQPVSDAPGRACADSRPTASTTSSPSSTSSSTGPPDRGAAQRARTATTGLTATRKADHLRINLEEDVAAKGVDSGFGAYRFMHCALPDIDLDEVSTATEVLGWQLAVAALHLLHDRRHRPRAAHQHGARRDRGRARHRAGARLRRASSSSGPRRCPASPFATSPPPCRCSPTSAPSSSTSGSAPATARASSTCSAPTRWCCTSTRCRRRSSPRATPASAGLLDRIEAVPTALPVPVIVKEVGWGISADLVTALLDAGVAAVDVAGAGGTSWSEVERHRLGGAGGAHAPRRSPAGASPPRSRSPRRAPPPRTAVIFASGGVRSGLDVAVASALGADLVGVAGPVPAGRGGRHAGLRRPRTRVDRRAAHRHVLHRLRATWRRCALAGGWCARTAARCPARTASPW